ncbi:DUF2992 domain-containing protein [Actinomyces sp. 432]|uniref:DUF2992 family protein n=1 Tax=Actinomyces sp. 432 TaxID=2057798 RepID=UPI0013738B01|nr:DUF2992 family protein [Actinomyces sp. 432]QHO90830.1 DUF2992 domain-containing protein [Actinomyces sp. 432]
MPHTSPTAAPSTTLNSSAESSVYFDGQFWVLVLTITSGGRVYAARQVLGALPSDAELYAWLLAHGGQLIDTALAGPGVQSASRGGAQRVNPKRAARQAAKQAALHAPSTASQEALARAREERGAARSHASAAERKRLQRERYEQRRERAKRRHRGH